MSDKADILLQRSSTAEVVADTLMSMIVSGSLKAGEPLRENDLAKRLGISRNSVRESIRLLEQSRLVKYEMHRGAIVSTPTQSDLEDLFRTRLHLELLAVQQKPSAEQLERIKLAFENLKKMADHHIAEPIVAADLELHKSIVALLGSERINGFYERISKELSFYFTVLSYADEEYLNPQESIVDRHEMIYRALLDGDTRAAKKAMTIHIEENFKRLSEILKERSAS